MRQLTDETKTACGLGGHTQETPGAGNGTWTSPGGGNAGPSARRPIGACVRKAGTRLAAWLVVIATSLGLAAPVDAQGVRQPYGATLTVEAAGSGHGCVSGRCDEALTQDVAWLGDEGRLIEVIRLDSGTLRVQLDGRYGSDFHQPFTLHLGSTALAFADATYSGVGDNDIFTWESTGLSWSAGDSVQVRITHPPLVAPPFSPKADIEVGSGWQRFSLAQVGSKDWFTVALENNKRYVIRIDTPQDSGGPGSPPLTAPAAPRRSTRAASTTVSGVGDGNTAPGRAGSISIHIEAADRAGATASMSMRRIASMMATRRCSVTRSGSKTGHRIPHRPARWPRYSVAPRRPTTARQRSRCSSSSTQR